MSTAERELLEAVNSNRFEAVRAILKSNPKIDLNKRNCLHWAISFGKVEMTNLLIAAGANVNAFGMAGKETPLIIALTRQHLTIVQILIEAGADVNLATPLGATPIMMAYTPAAATLLIQHGADVNARDKKGTTPLAKAVLYQRLEIAKLLIAAGAVVDCVDKFGYTPLVSAVEKGLDRFVEVLLLAGANCNVRTTSGSTVFEIAQSPAVLKLLEAHRQRGKGATTCDSKEEEGGTYASKPSSSNDSSHDSSNDRSKDSRPGREGVKKGLSLAAPSAPHTTKPSSFSSFTPGSDDATEVVAPAAVAYASPCVPASAPASFLPSHSDSASDSASQTRSTEQPRSLFSRIFSSGRLQERRASAPSAGGAAGLKSGGGSDAAASGLAATARPGAVHVPGEAQRYRVSTPTTSPHSSQGTAHSGLNSTPASVAAVAVVNIAGSEVGSGMVPAMAVFSESDTSYSSTGVGQARRDRDVPVGVEVSEASEVAVLAGQVRQLEQHMCAQNLIIQQQARDIAELKALFDTFKTQRS